MLCSRRRNLAGNQLIGIISRPLGAFKSSCSSTSMITGPSSSVSPAQTLDLAGNKLTGIIPRLLGGPRRLRFLHLGFNKLTGECDLSVMRPVS